MPELIDRQAALEIAMCYCPDDDGSCSRAGHDIREMLDELEALPTIELEVHTQHSQHGRWIRNTTSGGYNCSNCGHHVNSPIGEMIDPRDYECYLDKYCGGCGMRMDADKL